MREPSSFCDASIRPLRVHLPDPDCRLLSVRQPQRQTVRNIGLDGKKERFFSTAVKEPRGDRSYSLPPSGMDAMSAIDHRQG
nr:hypothetical protein [Mycobacterium sp. E802]